MNPFKKALIYSKKLVKTLVNEPRPGTAVDSILYFPSWWQHIKAGRNSVDDQIPWITFGCIDYIRKNIQPAMMVFEYGSGGSTLFWSSRVKKVVSIEHDREWYNRLSAELKKKGISNVEYQLVEASPLPAHQRVDYANPQHYASADPAYAGKSFEAYVKTIDKFADEYFDVIVVDGRARTSCILHAIPKLKKGGMLVVDNSDRLYYMSPFTFDKAQWERKDFAGPVPYTADFSKTTILRKLKN
jgi:precorrin-6B methylase 2